MKAAIEIRFLMVLWILFGGIVAATAEENRKKSSAFQEAVDAIDAQSRKSPAAEALKDLTGMTPEEYQASQASKRCFDVVIPPRGGQSMIASATNSILLNRCTGETWILDTVPINKDGTKGWRWFPVPVAQNEIVFPPPK